MGFISNQIAQATEIFNYLTNSGRVASNLRQLAPSTCS